MFSIILKEVKKVFITICILGIAVLGGTVAFNYFDSTVLYGFLFGSLYTLANFTLLGTISAKAVTMLPHRARQHMMLNYFIRYLLTAIVIYVGFKAPYIDGFVVIIMLFAPKITYYAIGFADFIKEAILIRKDK